MLQEYVKLNYLEEENLCRGIFFVTCKYISHMSKNYSVGIVCIQSGLTTL